MYLALLRAKKTSSHVAMQSYFLIKFKNGDGSIQCLIQAVPYDRAKTIDTMIIPK
jgi:hypothetical protein